MLVELLRHGGVDLTRRWVGALLLVPPEERAAIVDAVERQVVQLYAANEADDVSVSADVVRPKVKAQRLEQKSAAPPAEIPSPASIIEAKPARRRGK